MGGVAALCAVAFLGVTAAQAAPTSVTASVSAATTDPSAQKKKVDASIKETSATIAEVSAELSAAYAALTATEAKLPAARQALTDAEVVATQASAAEARAAQDLAVARANEAKAADHLASTRHEIDAGHRALAQFAAQLYQEQGMGQLSVAMSSSSPQEFADRLAMVGTVADLRQRSLTRLATAQADLVAQESHLVALRNESAAAQRAAAAALRAATTARDRAAAAKTALESLAAAQKRQSAAVAAKLDAEKKRLAAMKAESAKLAKILAERAAAARRAGRTGGSGGTGFLSAPVYGIAVSSEFGMRFHPILHAWILHEGRDYAAPCGTPVHAAADGVVVSAGGAGGYGNRIVIDHGYHGGVDLSTTYNHLSRFVVTGGHVTRGQVIAYSGTTGLSTGCHIHFETRQNGAAVDPRKWL